MLDSVLESLTRVVKSRTTWVISTSILATILIITTTKPPVDTSFYYREIDRLEQVILELEEKDNQISEEVDSLRSIKQLLTQHNENLKRELESLQDSYEESITFIDNASIDELTEFFTDRYRHLLRTSP